MKRASLFLFSLLSSLTISASGFITLNNINYTLDTLALYPVGPGCEYLSVRMRRVSDRGGLLDAFFLKVDANNPYITFQEVLGRDKVIGTETTSSMGSRISTPTHVTIGGTNGDFFATTGDVGRPTGMTIVNSEFAYIPDNHGSRRSGAIGDDGLGHIGSKVSFSGALLLPDTTLKIIRVNYKRGDNELVLFNHHNAATTLTNEWGTELAMEPVTGEKWATNCDLRAVVKARETGQGNMTIPTNGFVLSGHGTMAAMLDSIAIGDTLTVSLRFTIDGEPVNVAQAIGGDNYALIANNGVAEQTNFWNENHPRTAFGQSQNGDTLIFCVVDGRALSVGCTTKVLGELMVHNGAWKAVNWDGGGSSHLWLGGGLGLMNTGCEAAERACGNGMFVVADVPTDDRNIASIYSYYEPIRVPAYGMFNPEFLGYNQYGILINNHLEGVTISCDPSVGYINEQGAFVALADGVLHATYGDITHDIPVVIDNSAQIAMRLDSTIVSPASHYSVEVIGTIGNNVFTLHPLALQWRSADPSVAVVTEEGVLTGVAEGRTWIYASLADFTDSLLVISQVYEADPFCWDRLDDATHFTMKASASAWNTTITADDAHSSIAFNYTGGRNANIKFSSEAYLLADPDTVVIRYTPNGFPINKVGANLQAANNSISGINYVVENLPYSTDKEIEIRIPLDSLFGGEDQGIYPVTFNSFTFYLDTAAPKQAYTLDFGGVWLHYGTPQQPSKPSDIDPVQATQNTRLVRINGQLYILSGNQLYDLLGRKI